ncbi:hypothetical protein FOD75_10930 (plasmid) [Limosilactobacillus reuteri]|uniref:Uncharacterized protein n=1 Tax=Limosilactobacillus reuteri TaxID=1598 RepID=A0A517D8C0_LIMRT|nr:hypothetical protein [Limosilactobacillus reuteri]QDR73603.1 hypothetical protein FOD75_10930 [Limosilactobacillus reuteri]
MKQQILLAMDNGLADNLRNIFLDNSQDFQVLSQNVPIFHSLKASLLRYRPDIVFIAMRHVKFDTDNHEQELLNTIYDIKTNSELSRLRIAIQTSLPKDSPTLKQLAALGVYDIFSTHGVTRQLDMSTVTRQLGQPQNIKNVEEYLSLRKPFKGLNINPTNNSTIKPSSGVNADALKKSNQSLKQANRLLMSDRDQLTSRLNAPTVSRSDYDNLLSQVTDAVNAGLDDDKTKQLFAQIIQANKNQEKRIQQLEKDLNDRTAMIQQVTERNQQLAEQQASQSQGDNSGRIRQLVEENNKLKEQITQLRDQSSVKTSKLKSSSKRVPSCKRKKKSKKPMWIAIALVLIIALGFGFNALNSMGKSQAEAPEPYDSLIKKKEYAKAASAYPSRAVETENKMLADSSLKNKGDIASDINNTTTADAVQFDVAYFSSDFKEVVRLYEDSSSNSLLHPNAQRRTMLAYSYMKTGDVDNARSIAKPLNNDQLNQKIETYAKFQDANKTLEDKLKNGNLSDEDKNTARQQIKQNKAAMKKL